MNPAVDLFNLGQIIRERRETLGLTQSRLAKMSGLSRQTLVGLEAGALSDLGFNRVANLLSVLGLKFSPPSQVMRDRKRGLWMAAKNTSVSYAKDIAPDTLGRALVDGKVPQGYAAHLTHLLEESPVPLVVMAVEEAAAKGGGCAQGRMEQCRQACQVARSAPARSVGMTKRPPADVVETGGCHAHLRAACDRYPEQIGQPGTGFVATFEAIAATGCRPSLAHCVEEAAAYLSALKAR